MIRIYKENEKKYVTKGAYEMFYKPLGYKLIIEETKVQLDEEVRPARRNRGSSNKKNNEGDSNDLSNIE